MLRAIFIRLLILAIVIYLLYALKVYIESRRKDKTRKKTVNDLEAADYDKDEWEKIKKELENHG